MVGLRASALLDFGVIDNVAATFAYYVAYIVVIRNEVSDSNREHCHLRAAANRSIAYPSKHRSSDQGMGAFRFSEYYQNGYDDILDCVRRS